MKTTRQTPLRRARRPRGYTAVEVLSAMTLFAIGAAGVIGMQRVTIKGGTDARRFDVAANLASQWAHRLHRDSMQWTLPSVANPTTSNLDKTAWLGKILEKPGEWISPPQTTVPGLSASFDVFGRDVVDHRAEEDGGGSDETIFCVQHRLSWLASPLSTDTEGDVHIGPGGLIHAEVRVVWARLDSAPIDNCSDLEVTSTTESKYHFVHASTAIRPNPNE